MSKYGGFQFKFSVIVFFLNHFVFEPLFFLHKTPDSYEHIHSFGFIFLFISIK